MQVLEANIASLIKQINEIDTKSCCSGFDEYKESLLETIKATNNFKSKIRSTNNSSRK